MALIETLNLHRPFNHIPRSQENRFLPFSCGYNRRQQVRVVVSTSTNCSVCCGKLTPMVKIFFSLAIRQGASAVSLFDILQCHAQNTQNYPGKTFFSALQEIEVG